MRAKNSQPELSRREFIRNMGWLALGVAGSGSLGSLLVSCGSQAPKEAQPLKLQLNWIRNVEFGGVWYAMEKGFYQEEGIDLSIEDWAPTVEPIQSVVGGTADVGFVSNGLTIASARANGLPVKAFGAGFQKSPGGLVTLAEKGILAPADLKGKIIGIQQTGRLTWDAFAAINGLTGEVETMVVGFDATPLVAGQVDAYMGYITNQPLALKAQGIDTNFMLYADYGFPRYDLVAFATDDALKEKKNLIVSWLKATNRGWEYTIQHPDEVAQLVVEKYGTDLNLDQQKGELQVQIGLMQSQASQDNTLFWMEEDVWQTGIDSLESIGELSTPLKVDDFVTWDILKAAK